MSNILLPTKERLLRVSEITCRIFRNIYNPEKLRLGNKVLRKRLIGPSIVDYHPQPEKNVRKLLKIAASIDKAQFELVDAEETARLTKIENLRRRGKGAPKKITYEELLKKKAADKAGVQTKKRKK